MNIDMLRHAINVEGLAVLIAHGSDHDQAAFINALAQEMRRAIRSEYDRESQMCFIERSLTTEGRKFVTTLAEFVKLGEEAQTL